MPAIAIKDTGEFAKEILKDLIEQGYNGQELLQKIAPYETYEDVFGKK